MSGFKGIMKDGWHPKGKEGGKESWRGEFKGINQVAGWVGRGKGADTARTEHVARPLSSLRDPSSFAPPPRRGTTGSPGGLGSALTPEQLQAQDQRRQEEEAAAAAEAARPAPPPVPYRADTTGFSTAHLPKPPVRRNIASDDLDTGVQGKPAVKPKPKLPPRLPPRNTAANPPAEPPSPPPAYQESVSQLNQGAINRLGNAGVSVPGFGIGSQAPASQNTSQFNPQNELQERFARMKTSPTPPVPATTSTVTTTAPAVTPPTQHHGFDPQPQSMPPQQHLQRAASNMSTQERPSPTGSQSSIRDKWTNIDQKYGIKKRINNFIEDQKSPAYPAPTQQHPPPQQTYPYQQQPQYPQQYPYQQASPQPYAQPQPQPQPLPPHHSHPSSPYTAPAQNTSRPDLEALNRRKPPPPPPPPKKPGLAEAVSGGQGQAHPGAPPPLPMATKPR